MNNFLITTQNAFAFKILGTFKNKGPKLNIKWQNEYILKDPIYTCIYIYLN